MNSMLQVTLTANDELLIGKILGKHDELKTKEEALLWALRNVETVLRASPKTSSFQIFDSIKDGGRRLIPHPRPSVKPTEEGRTGPGSGLGTGRGSGGLGRGGRGTQ